MKPSSRRRFLSRLGLGAAGATLPAATRADEPPAEDGVASLMKVVQLRYGRFLNDAQRREVEDQIRGNLHLAERLYRFPLDPAEEPATVFPADAEE